MARFAAGVPAPVIRHSLRTFEGVEHRIEFVREIDGVRYINDSKGTNPDSTAFFDEVGTAFKEKTGADLDVQMVPWASAKEKFATAIAGGTTPDVAEVGNTWTAEFAEAGALVDLTSRVEGDGLNGDLHGSADYRANLISVITQRAVAKLTAG